VPDVSVANSPLQANRAVIQMGEVKQIVYYWFQQRGRIITNEYLVKWYLFWDALTRQRTDGALVRLTTAVPYGGNVSDGDRLLQDFARDVSKELDKHIPD
jgi:EpsI family protein